ncbi:MAG: NADH:ubiquinone oxidoreductase subunit RnfG, partial [Zetaproteobacteria bacterium CG02_land_8_20_14_3_00_50_9]
TSHHETPGLGDGITLNHAWLDSFVDKTLTQTSWKVRKDGGDFDQFTGATISPRAVVKAVKAGLELFELHKVRILAPSEQKIQGKPNE